VFSEAKYTLTDHRHRLLPVTLEQLIFLAYNREWWDQATVHQAIGIVDGADDGKENIDADDEDDDDDEDDPFFW